MARKKYYAGYIGAEIIKNHTSGSGKAIYFTVAGGYTALDDTTVWLPNSQIIFGDPNECGNCKVYIPAWLLDTKRIDILRLREFSIIGIVEM